MWKGHLYITKIPEHSTLVANQETFYQFNKKQYLTCVHLSKYVEAILLKGAAISVELFLSVKHLDISSN